MSVALFLVKWWAILMVVITVWLVVGSVLLMRPKPKRDKPWQIEFDRIAAERVVEREKREAAAKMAASRLPGRSA